MKQLRRISSGLFLVGSAAVAMAQVPTIPVGQAADPSVSPPTTAAPAPAAPAASQRPVIIPIGADGRPIMEDAPATETGVYYTDDDNGLIDTGEVYTGNQTPELHIVRSGDTLWDICGYYFNDSWQWPKVWSYNPKIANPHLIYPGDGVRLLPEGQASGVAPLATSTATTSTTGAASDVDVAALARKTPSLPARRGAVAFRQTAFVSKEDLKTAMEIVGSNDDKTLMVTDDEVYLSYDPAEPPTVGQRYSIYEVKKQIKHPKTGATVGAYVTVLGDVEITGVRQDKHARGVLRRTTGAIERGAKVGAAARQYKTIDPVPAKDDVQGVIVAIFSETDLIGSGDVVFLDVGEDAGLEVGNRMFAIRRGDMLRKDLNHAGVNDKAYPARIVGEVLVVETGKNFAVAMVTLAAEELGVSDIVTTQAGQ